MKWEVVPRDEQETIITINYYDKTLTFYTSRKSVAERIKKKVGEPTDIDENNNKISSVSYTRNLHDKNIKAFLSMSTTIGGFRNEKKESNKNIAKERTNN